MYRAKIHLDLSDAGILSELTGAADAPFEVYEEEVHADDTVTFRIDARQHRDEFYDRLAASDQVAEVRRVDETHLLIRKQAMGALPIIRENHGTMQGIDWVYGTKRILDVMVFRLEDLRAALDGLESVGDVFLGKLVPIGTPASRLTDRQQAALNLALERGYYRWPRDAEARELAAELGIAHPTFLEHLRKAERKVLEAAFVEERTAPTPQERAFLLSTA